MTLPAAAQTTAQAQLEALEKQTGQRGDAEAGRLFFINKHGNDWSCATCHGTPPIKDGEHASTGKRLAPLAPAYNAKAFTSLRRTNKWFRRNCNDVLERTCSDEEKVNVLAYLISLQR